MSRGFGEPVIAPKPFGDVAELTGVEMPGAGHGIGQAQIVEI